MKLSLRKTICSLLSFLFLLSSLILNVYADNGLSISSSASSVKEGAIFTVTVKASDSVFISDLSLTVTGGTVTSGLSRSSLDKGETATAKIKLTGSSCNVKITGTSANYQTETETTAVDSLTVKKKAETTNNNTGTNNSNTNNNNNDTNNNNNNTSTINKSSDNALKSLTVSNGTLSPSFKASKTRYDISLAGNVTEVTINAKANHSKATVSGMGKKSLKAGDNTFNVVCKAENGSTKTYTLNFHVDETPLVYTKFNDKDLGVVRTLDNIKSPTNFKQGSITLEDQEITGFINEKTGMKLAYLIDEKGNKDFYIVKDGVVVSVFKKISINGKEYVLVTAENELEEVKNLTPSKIKINDIELDGWNFSDKIHSNYCVVYLMNSEGKEALYCYETTEGTLQLYSPFEIASEEKLSELDLNIFVITTGLFAITTIISIIYIIYYKKKKISEIREYYERRTQKQGE